MILQVLVACLITTLVSTQNLQSEFNRSQEINDQFDTSNSSAVRGVREDSETTGARTNKEQGLTANNQTPLAINNTTGYNDTDDDEMPNQDLRNADEDYEGTVGHPGQGATNQNMPEEIVSVTSDPVIVNSDSERTVSSYVPDISGSSVRSKDNISTESMTGGGQSEELQNGASSTAISTLTLSLTNESSSPKGHDVTVAIKFRNSSIASEISSFITGDNSTLISNLITSSIDGQQTDSTIESDISISKMWSYDNISTAISTGDGPRDERRLEDSSTDISTVVNESSSPNGHHVNVTTEFNNTSVTSSDGDTFMKMIETAAYKLYVGAAVVFSVCLLVTIVVGLTVLRRRQRETRRQYELKRISQRSQIPQMEKLYTMAAFVAATDGADASRTMTRTATVGRRPQGPRPVVTAASMPLLDNSNVEDLAQVRKEMFSDVRTWAPERRTSNPPSRNFFK